MIQDRTSVFPNAFTELAFGPSDVLKVAPFTFYQVYKIFGVLSTSIPLSFNPLPTAKKPSVTHQL